MGRIEKNGIVNALRVYCERYESQARAAASLGISGATVSQMLAGNWELISEEMWRKVASGVGVKESKWTSVETGPFRDVMSLLDDAHSNSLMMAATGDAGTGKSFACKYYRNNHKRVYMLECETHWNKKRFLSELLQAMGRDGSGCASVSEMVMEAVRLLKGQDGPLLIIDEADKLEDSVLCFFITLYNQLEDECGIVLFATDKLDLRLRKGLRLHKLGYNEVWSRLGRRCVELHGVTAADIVAVCEANGVTEKKHIDRIIENADADLRRVKRMVHAIRRNRDSKIQ
jgi:DNA transposition AAA+ family ATPase